MNNSIKIIFTILMLIFLSMPSLADEYYIGQWEWNVYSPNISEWDAPLKEFRTGAIDLRTIPQRAKPGGTPEGYAIFSYSKKVTHPNLFYIGNDLTSPVSAGTLAQIKNRLKIIEAISSNNLKDILWELLTLHSDPTGQSRWKPLKPGINNKMELHFGKAGKIKEIVFIPFESPEWSNVLAVIHEDYKRMIKTEPHVSVAKHLDFLEKKHGIPYQILIPEDAGIKLASLPHKTTITENFNCANSEALDCNLAWTEDLRGDHDISSNQALCNTTDDRCWSMVDTDLSGSDHYAQAVGSQVDSSRGRGTFVRKDSTTTWTMYGCIHINSSGGNSTKRIHEITGSTVTTLNDVTNADPAGSDTLKCEINGSTITLYLNGSSYVTATDTSITGNLRTGLHDYNNVYTNDNFEAGDLVTAITDYFYDSTFYDSQLY